MNACGRLSLKNVTFLPFQDEALWRLTPSPRLMLASSPWPNPVRASQCRATYYAMAAGTALLGISRDTSDLAQVIRQHDCGVNIEPGHVSDAAAALLDFLHHPETIGGVPPAGPGRSRSLLRPPGCTSATSCHPRVRLSAPKSTMVAIPTLMRTTTGLLDVLQARWTSLLLRRS